MGKRGENERENSFSLQVELLTVDSVFFLLGIRRKRAMFTGTYEELLESQNCQVLAGVHSRQ